MYIALVIIYTPRAAGYINLVLTKINIGGYCCFCYDFSHMSQAYTIVPLNVQVYQLQKRDVNKTRPLGKGLYGDTNRGRL